MAPTFEEEFTRQSHAFAAYGYPEASGLDNGMWYGGFLGLFYRENDEHSRSRLAAIDMTPGELRVPFLLVMGETMFSVPRQMQLLNGGTWNGDGKPSLLPLSGGAPMSQPHRAWLAVDVQLHVVEPGGSCYPVAEAARRRDRRLATICDGIALAVTRPDLLDKHRAFGCYGSAPLDYEAPYIHADVSPWNQSLPQGKPNLFAHSVGHNVFNGLGGAVLSYASVISLESVMQNSYSRYEARLAQAQAAR
jgi:hypothetical protein